MPRKAAAASAGEDDFQAEQSAPRRSTRIASQPRTEEEKPAPRPRAAKKRTADDAKAAGAGEEDGEEKGKAKKVSYRSGLWTHADMTCFLLTDAFRRPKQTLPPRALLRDPPTTLMPLRRRSRPLTLGTLSLILF